MSQDVNKVILIGNLGKDPEVRSFQNGGKKVSFSIATSRSYKKKGDDDWTEVTEWHNVVSNNEFVIKLAERSLQKGTRVYIEGQVMTRKYDKDGEDRYITEIVIPPYQGVLAVQARGKGSNGDGGQSEPGATEPDIDDDIPF